MRSVGCERKCLERQVGHVGALTTGCRTVPGREGHQPPSEAAIFLSLPDAKLSGRAGVRAPGGQSDHHRSPVGKLWYARPQAPLLGLRAPAPFSRASQSRERPRVGAPGTPGLAAASLQLLHPSVSNLPLLSLIRARDGTWAYLRFKSLNFIPSAKRLCHIRRRIHRSQGLGQRHPWGHYPADCNHCSSWTGPAGAEKGAQAGKALSTARLAGTGRGGWTRGVSEGPIHRTYQIGGGGSAGLSEFLLRGTEGVS